MKILGMPAIVYVLVPIGVALELGSRVLVTVVLLPFDVLDELRRARRRIR